MNFPKRKPIANLPNPEAFDVNDIDPVDDIESEMARVVRDRVPAPPPPEKDIEVVLADTVIARHEALAKRIEEWRPIVKELSTLHQTALADLEATLVHIDETTQRCMALGERDRDQLKKSSGIMARIRALMDAANAEMDAEESKSV